MAVAGIAIIGLVLIPSSPTSSLCNQKPTSNASAFDRQTLSHFKERRATMNHVRCLLLVLILRFGLIPGVSTAEVDTPGADTQTEAAETEETAPTILFLHWLPEYPLRHRSAAL